MARTETTKTVEQRSEAQATERIAGEPVGEMPEQRSKEEQDEREQLLDAIANMTRESVLKLIEQISTKEQDTPDLIEAKIKKWLLSQNIQTKLAVVLLEGFGIDDHGTKELWEEVTNSYEVDILNIAKTADLEESSEDMFMAGVCGELLVWRKHY